MQHYLWIACGLAIALLQAQPTLARPVSYPGGWTLMQMNDADASTLHVHYSPTARYSVGYKAEYWNDKDWQFHGAQLNYLLKRWNKPELSGQCLPENWSRSGV